MHRSVRSALLIPLTVTGLLTGCVSTPDQSDEVAPPFVLRSLNLNQRRDDGSRDWDLTSPEARYDLESRTVQAQRPSGVVYRDDQPYLRISARQATVVNDGDRIVLEGSVQLQQLKGQRLLIEGDRLVWTPDDSNLVIDRTPTAVDSRSKLSAERFVLLQDRDQLRLDGPTRLLHWSEERSEETDSDTEILGGSGSWNLQSGRLKVSGPVTARRNDDSVLKASSLEGDTAEQFLDLIKPVSLNLGSDRGTVSAQTTRWNYVDRQFRSAGPVEGRRKEMRMRGTGFLMDEQSSTLVVLSACRLDQPGEQLQAQRCSWNWESQEIIAESDAQRLKGRVGDDDRLQFNSTDERVRSQFRLPPSSVSEDSGAPDTQVTF